MRRSAAGFRGRCIVSIGIVIGAVLCALPVAAQTVEAGESAPATIGPTKSLQGFYELTTNTTAEVVTPIAPAACTGTSLCFFIFNRVPAGQQLVITQVSCELFSTPGVLYAAALATERNGSFPFRTHWLVVNRAATSWFNLNQNVLKLFDVGERPVLRVSASASSTISGACTIAGLIRTAP